MDQTHIALLMVKMGELSEELQGRPPYDTKSINLTEPEVLTIYKALNLLKVIRESTIIAR